LKPDNCIIVGAHSSDDAIWSDGNDAKKNLKDDKWKLMLVDFGFARSLSPNDLQKDPINSEVMQKDADFSLDEALDPKSSLYSACKTNAISAKSMTKQDIVEMSAIGSKPFAAPEITAGMKKKHQRYDDCILSQEKEKSFFRICLGL